MAFRILHFEGTWLPRPLRSGRGNSGTSSFTFSHTPSWIAFPSPLPCIYKCLILLLYSVCTSLNGFPMHLSRVCDLCCIHYFCTRLNRVSHTPAKHFTMFCTTFVLLLYSPELRFQCTCHAFMISFVFVCKPLYYLCTRLNRVSHTPAMHFTTFALWPRLANIILLGNGMNTKVPKRCTGSPLA